MRNSYDYSSSFCLHPFSSFFLFQRVENLRALARLLRQHVAHQIADARLFGIGDAVNHVFTFALGRDDAVRAQNGEVLRNFCLRQIGRLNDIAHALGTFPQDVNDAKPRGIAHRFAHFGLQVKN